MYASRMLMSGIAAMSLAFAGGPAFAKANLGAAHKLALVGAESAYDCVSRPDKDGKWHQESNGNWAKCKDVGGADEGGGGLGMGYVLGAAAGVTGIIVAVVASGKDKPSSP